MTPRPVIDRVIAKVEIDAETGCWIWKGGTVKSRRGRRPKMALPNGTKHGKTVLVARVMCELRHGAPPVPRAEAAHRCPQGENQLCVNGDHLEWAHRIRNEAMKRRRHG